MLPFSCTSMGSGSGVFVDIERNEYIVLHEEVAYLGIVPNGEFHFAAVHAAMAGEVYYNGLTRLTSVSHTGFVVAELSFDFHRVEVEILRRNGRCKGTDSLDGSTPEAGNHVDGKGQRNEGHEETGHRGVAFVGIVVGELEEAEQVDTQQGENNNPKSRKASRSSRCQP